MATFEYTFVAHVDIAEKFKTYLDQELGDSTLISFVVVLDENTVQVIASRELTLAEQSQVEQLANAYTSDHIVPFHPRMRNHVRVSNDANLTTEFNQISDAVAYAHSIYPEACTIEVYSGFYMVYDTIELLSGMALVAIAGGSSTIIYMPNPAPNKPIVALKGSSSVTGCVISSSGGGIAIHYDGSALQGAANVQQVRTWNVDIGVMGDGNVLMMNNAIAVITCEIIGNVYGIHVRAGAVLTTNQCLVIGGTCGILMEGVHPYTMVPTYGSVALLNIVNSALAMKLDGAKVDLRAAALSYCGRGLEVTENGTPSSILSDVAFIGNQSWDMEINALPATHTVLAVMACTLDRNKILNLHRIPLMWHSLSLIRNQEKHIFSGDLHIGDYITPTRMIVGRGESNFHEMIILREASNVWDDMTNNVRNLTPFSIWSSTNIGATLYVGHEDMSFAGLRVQIITGGDAQGIWEYNSPTGWITCPVMAISKDPPFTHYTTNVFDHANNSDIYVMFGPMPDCTPLLIGPVIKEMYYMRFRKTGEGTTPVVKSIMPILDSAITSENGYTLRFGNSRSIKLHNFVSRTSWSYQNFEENQDTYFATTIIVPDELDTSCPIKFAWDYVVSSATAFGNIHWTVTWQYLSEGDGVILTEDNWLESASLTMEDYADPITLNDVGKLRKCHLEFVIQNAHPGKDTLALQLIRRGTEMTDTVTGTALLVNSYMQYTAFMDGRNIGQVYESGY